ncbi:anti-sigma factor family protein [Micromonospora globbae]|uniref:RNA polymerase subunit sigma n=1 Tax=Micromonospora globbae TaxID=1894969 RepID=A0A420EZM7_9ACTN|nr:zf-HC2 domain-containing protein [Micromonospora globbae]RKF26171.1 RNA polymerase subunit sigma [Micromonospora globbae]WTF87857.1 zf-HC2 domain-containing protein [Micromonospora globbae]
MSRADHMDVAAYALGVLDEQDTARFEEHLATCWACAAELETMVPVVGLLSGIDGETMTALEQTATDPRLLDRTLMAVRADRRRTRLRQLLATAAAVVVLGGLTAIGFHSVLEDVGPTDVVAEPSVTAPVDVPPTPGSPPTGPGIGGPNEVEGDQVTATDATTGVTATMFLVERDYGTQINFSLGRLPGPRTCRLVVVRADAGSEVVSTWSVPESGYGTNTRAQELELTAATAAKKDQIKQIQVQSVDARGVASPLVTVKP